MGGAATTVVARPLGRSSSPAPSATSRASATRSAAANATLPQRMRASRPSLFVRVFVSIPVECFEPLEFTPLAAVKFRSGISHKTHSPTGREDSSQMANRTYDLIVLIDADAPSDTRSRIINDTTALINQHGDVKQTKDWGLRPTPYRIDHHEEATYQVFQFETSPETIEKLDRSLKLTEGILRFRLFQSESGDLPDSPPAFKREERAYERPPANVAATENIEEVAAGAAEPAAPEAAGDAAAPVADAAAEPATAEPATPADESAPEPGAESDDTAPAQAPADEAAEVPAE